MERFWVFLEALASFLEDGRSIDALKRALSEMPQTQRDRMIKYLQAASDNLPRILAESD
jgi:hypothetical protein